MKLHFGTSDGPSRLAESQIERVKTMNLARIFYVFAAAIIMASSPAFAGSIAVSDAVGHVTKDAEHGDTIEIFMNIDNSASGLDRIYAIRSKIAGEGRIAGGGAKADEHGDHEDHLLATSIDLPAGKTTQLHEEGSHLELAKLKKTPEPGDEITVTLFFEQAGRVNVTVAITEEDH